MSSYFRALSTAHTPGARERERHKSSILMLKSAKSKLAGAQGALWASTGKQEKHSSLPGQKFCLQREDIRCVPSIGFPAQATCEFAAHLS